MTCKNKFHCFTGDLFLLSLIENEINYSGNLWNNFCPAHIQFVSADYEYAELCTV